MDVIKNRYICACIVGSLHFFVISMRYPFMTFASQQKSRDKLRKVSWLFLAFFWILGILTGIRISLQAGSPFLSLMRRAFCSPVSIVGLLSGVSLPFLFSAFAVFLSKPQLVQFFSFFDGILYGTISLCAIRSSFDAGWLVQPLFCFSLLLSAPLSYWFRLRCLSEDSKPSAEEVFFFLSLAVLVGCYDYSCVSPFWAKLIF